MRRAISPSIHQLFRCAGTYEHIPTLLSDVWDRDGPCHGSRESKKASPCFSSRLSPSDLSCLHRSFATKSWREGLPGWWMHELNMTDHVACLHVSKCKSCASESITILNECYSSALCQDCCLRSTDYLSLTSCGELPWLSN